MKTQRAIERYLPIWGVLWKLESKANLEGLAQLFITVVFTTMPIWLSSLIATTSEYTALPADDRSLCVLWELFWTHMRAAVSNAELFMFVTAALGSSVYLLIDSVRRSSPPHPWFGTHVILALLVSVVASAFFFSFRDSETNNDTFVIFLSLAMYLFSLFLLLPSMALDHQEKRLNLESAQAKDQEEFQDGYSKHRGQS